jgi:hypothetical protein
MEPFRDAAEEYLEVLPLVVVAQTFPARPSSIPDIRDFVRRCLAQSPLSEDDSRAVTQTVSDALLEAAGPTGTIQVSFRIFPDHAEVDVLRSHPDRDLGPVGSPARFVPLERARPAPEGDGYAAPLAGGGPATMRGGTATAPAIREDESTSFADWMSGALRREGMTMEVAARQLGVSVKTVSRWVGGATEPRLRDLRRIQELFGELPFP